MQICQTNRYVTDYLHKHMDSPKITFYIKLHKCNEIDFEFVIVCNLYSPSWPSVFWLICSFSFFCFQLLWNWERIIVCNMVFTAFPSCLLLLLFHSSRMLYKGAQFCYIHKYNFFYGISIRSDFNKLLAIIFVYEVPK